MAARTGLAVLGAAWAAAALPATVEWNRTPIGVVLEVGTEQQIRFEGKATVGVPAELAETGALATLFVNDTAYWTARAPFDRRRLPVRLDATGEFVLFDVEAVPAMETGFGPPEPLEVVVVRPEKRSTGTGGRQGRADVRTGLVELIRFAARRDLGPARLVDRQAAIVAVRTDTADVTALYRHPDMARTAWRVRGQWTLRGLFVTSIEVRNTGVRPVDLDPRHFQFSAGGAWNGSSRGFVAVGCARYALAPAGEEGSRTMVHVVTEQPFDAAVSL